MWTRFLDWLAGLPQSSVGFLGMLVGLSFGFIALLLGALFNAHLNRRRDDVLRRKDRLATASALSAELTSLHRRLIESAQSLDDHPPAEGQGFMVLGLSHSVQVFPHFLPKIGLLPPDAIRKIIDAYLLVEQYTESLLLLGGSLQQNMPADTRIIFMPRERASTVSALNRNRAQFLEAAIQALAKVR